MTYIQSLTGAVNTLPTILVASTTELANVKINAAIIKGTVAVVNSTSQFVWDPASTTVPSATVIQPLDGTNPGRWLLTTFNAGGVASAAVITDGGTTVQNIRGNKSSHQSHIDNTKSGIVNLGSDTTDVASGAAADFSTILGGDANVATGSYATVPGGKNNTAAGNYSVAQGNAAITSHTGEVAQSSGIISTAGDVLASKLTAFGTVSNSLTEIFVDGSSETISLSGNMIVGFIIKVSCFNSSSHKAGYWIFSGAAKSNSGTVSLVGAFVNKQAFLDDNSWDASVDVSGTHIRIRALGDASGTNKAVACIELTRTLI